MDACRHGRPEGEWSGGLGKVKLRRSVLLSLLAGIEMQLALRKIRADLWLAHPNTLAMKAPFHVRIRGVPDHASLVSEDRARLTLAGRMVARASWGDKAVDDEVVRTCCERGFVVPGEIPDIGDLGGQHWSDEPSKIDFLAA